jgi:hypothetical protein
LPLSALQVVVAMAASAGAEGLEAATTDAAQVTPDDLEALRDLAGSGVPVLLLDARGRLVDRVET